MRKCVLECVVLLTLTALGARNAACQTQPEFVFGWFNGITTATSGQYSISTVPQTVKIVDIFDLLGMPQYDHDSTWWNAVVPQIDTLHQRGQSVVFCIWLTRAFNGNNGSPSYPNTAAGYAAFAQELSNEIANYHLDGIDVDVESGVIESTDAENEGIMNALSQYFGPKSGTGKLFLYDTNQAGSTALFSTTHGNYNYVVQQAYWNYASSLTSEWNTYASYISPSQYIVTVDFQDGTGWSTQYSSDGQPEIYDYANWNPLQGNKGGAGAYGINYDYANSPSYKYTAGTYAILSGQNTGSNCASNLQNCNVNAIYTDGTAYSTGGIDGYGYAYSSNALGTSLSFGGVNFTFGPANSLDAVKGATISLPSGTHSKLVILATAVNGNQASQNFVVKYSDGSQSTFTQSLSDWYTPNNYSGESQAKAMSYRTTSTGAPDNRPFYLYGYSFTLASGKTASSVQLPANSNVVVLGLGLQ